MARQKSKHRSFKHHSDVKKSKHVVNHSQFWLWGIHPVLAVIEKAERKIHKLLLTEKTREKIPSVILLPDHQIVPAEDISAVAGEEAVHQGIAACVERKEGVTPEDLLKKEGRQCFVALDQVTDPHNVGAILRSAAVFGVDGLILPRDHAPQESGTMAKSACGALEQVPLCYETNLVRGLERLKKEGFWVVGLAEEGTESLQNLNWPEKTIIVMGSEDKGMRPSVQVACDYLVKIPSAGAFSTLNVSNAAAVCFYSWFDAVDS